MPTTPAKRRRPRSSSTSSDLSTDSLPDLATLLNTPRKSKPKPKISPRKVQRRDCILGQAYTPSLEMDARIKSFAKEIADDWSRCNSTVSEQSHKEVVARQEVTIKMEIRITTVAGKETIVTTDPELSQEIDLGVVGEGKMNMDNGSKVKKEAGSMEGLSASPLEGEKIKEETDDVLDAKTES